MFKIDKEIKNDQQGFTLIEMVIYIALFSLIMSGAIVSIYGILGSSSRNATKAMIQEEGSFLLGKVDWILTNAQDASVSADGLTLTTTDYDGKVMKLSVSSDGENMSIDEDVVDGIYKGISLNNSNVFITCNPLPSAPGCFAYTEGSSDGIDPTSVSADFTLHTKTSEGSPYSQAFSTIRFLRK
jgi:prepilin-type N-terminal cleavage/methylation domain-containing protein